MNYNSSIFQKVLMDDPFLDFSHIWYIYSFFFKIISLIDLFSTVLGLCCCTGFFSSCRERWQLSSCGAWASPCAGFSCHRAQAPGCTGSAVVSPELWSTGLVVVAHKLGWSAACGFFMGQGWNPCLLHWQPVSSSQSHIGSLICSFYTQERSDCIYNSWVIFSFVQDPETLVCCL